MIAPFVIASKDEELNVEQQPDGSLLVSNGKLFGDLISLKEWMKTQKPQFMMQTDEPLE